MRLFQRFRQAQTGHMGIMLALTIVPLMLCVGAAVDMVQTNRTLTILQGAADAAALSAASSGERDNAQLYKLVEEYLKANGALAVLDDVDKVSAQLDDKKNVFVVSIEGSRKTSLMQIGGIVSMDLVVRSEVSLGAEAYEVALVLDNTASMSQGGRMSALKAAAKDLVDKLLQAKKTGAHVRLGVVPFASYVNVGLSRRSELWMDVPPDSSSTQKSCWNTYPDAKGRNCKRVPQIIDGVATGGEVDQCDWDYGAPKEVCGIVDVSEVWSGCVGSREEPLDEDIGQVSIPYKGLMNTSCGSEILELTDDETKLKKVIDGLVPTGNTYVPAGLLWGWHMLDPNEPLSKAKTKASMAAMGGTKAIVLMTDGENTLAPYAPYHWGEGNPADWARGDAKTQKLCDNIKKDGITIYTVAFMVTEPAALALMSGCASDPSKALTASSAVELSKVFDNIGESLLAIRLSR